MCTRSMPKAMNFELFSSPRCLGTSWGLPLLPLCQQVWNLRPTSPSISEVHNLYTRPTFILIWAFSSLSKWAPFFSILADRPDAPEIVEKFDRACTITMWARNATLICVLVVRHRMSVVTCSKWDSIHIVANAGVGVQHSHLKQSAYFK